MDDLMPMLFGAFLMGSLLGLPWAEHQFRALERQAQETFRKMDNNGK